ncbi:DUF2790 domain-containing protein [Pseudomonas sp. C1C7]|uniref:DUF2790 domain-containing protein n=1 Tax=Pseudomonas sp. C1C7 TaxID=2735272 RepID=UPI0015860E10|nr:DUF2790 domain-containing protein [Pseudomonas sp. C1C7]NUT78489.1 DUF2790 domain-containing protein [Pseudomonas sp. C1C7]
MNISKIAIILALGSFGTQAFAEENKSPVEPYTYDSHLDIKKVITITDIPNNICGPVPAQMTYEDSNGQRHVMQYQVMGNGCSNG